MAIGLSNKTQRKASKSGLEESEYYDNVDGVVVNHFHQVSVVLIVERLTPQLLKENYVKKTCKRNKKVANMEKNYEFIRYVY